MSDLIKYLVWDSDFFNKKIGKIDYDNYLNLSDLLYFSRKENYELIYVFGDENFYPKSEILEQYNGKLVDRKVLYKKYLNRIFSYSKNIRLYESAELTPELEHLAYISGEFSRFKLDKNFNENDFYRMYKTWIENSLSAKNADYIFVAEENEKIEGMVTLKIIDNTGHIGLIAVSPDTQGKGYGKALIQTCENILLTKDISVLEVPTQLNNLQACRFYEKCGFEIKKITNIYHFWL